MNNACYVAQLAYLYTRPRLFYQFSVDNKGRIISLNSKSYPGHHFEPVYCIVNRFNSRVQLLRTKQRVLGSAGMLAAVAEPFGFSTPTHLSNISWPNGFYLFISRSGLFWLCSPTYSPIVASAFSQQHIFFLYFLISIKFCKLPQTSPHHFLPQLRYR